MTKQPMRQRKAGPIVSINDIGIVVATMTIRTLDDIRHLEPLGPISFTSSIDFPEEHTDREDVIRLCHDMRSLNVDREDLF